MAKFCTKCGKALEDGKPCSCEKETPIEKEQEVESSNNLFNDYFDVLKGLFKKPVVTLKKYAKEEHMTLGIISIVINAIALGLFIHFMLNNILKAMGLDMNTISTTLEGLETYGVQLGIDTNFGLKAGIIMAVLSFVIVGIMYFMHSVVFKKSIDIKKIVAMVGVSEIFFTIGIFISLILSFIQPIIAVIVALLFVIIFFVHLHQGLVEIATLDSNQIVYTMAVSVIIPLILFLVVMVLMISFDLVAIMTDTYAKSAIRSGL